MNAQEIQAFADNQRREIGEIAEKARKLPLETLNDALNLLMAQHKPIHEKRVSLSMQMVIYAMEIRLRMLQAAFPHLKVEEITQICELPPTDHVIGETEKWIERIKTAGFKPGKIQIDRVRMILRLLE